MTQSRAENDEDDVLLTHIKDIEGMQNFARFLCYQRSECVIHRPAKACVYPLNNIGKKGVSYLEMREHKELETVLLLLKEVGEGNDRKQYLYGRKKYDAYRETYHAFEPYPLGLALQLYEASQTVQKDIECLRTIRGEPLINHMQKGRPTNKILLMNLLFREIHCFLNYFDDILDFNCREKLDCLAAFHEILSCSNWDIYGNWDTNEANKHIPFFFSTRNLIGAICDQSRVGGSEVLIQKGINAYRKKNMKFGRALSFWYKCIGFIGVTLLGAVVIGLPLAIYLFYYKSCHDKRIERISRGYLKLFEQLRKSHKASRFALKKIAETGKGEKKQENWFEVGESLLPIDLGELTKRHPGVEIPPCVLSIHMLLSPFDDFDQEFITNENFPPELKGYLKALRGRFQEGDFFSLEEIRNHFTIEWGNIPSPIRDVCVKLFFDNQYWWIYKRLDYPDQNHVFISESGIRLYRILLDLILGAIENGDHNLGKNMDEEAYKSYVQFVLHKEEWISYSTYQEKLYNSYLNTLGRHLSMDNGNGIQQATSLGNLWGFLGNTERSNVKPKIEPKNGRDVSSFSASSP